MERRNRVVVVGGGPGGYEAALVAAHLGAEVTVVDSDGLGGAAVLTDCVPSKTLIATADYLGELEVAADLGVDLGGRPGAQPAGPRADLAAVNARVRALAAAQSDDIAGRLAEVGVRVVTGTAYVQSPDRVRAEAAGSEILDADVLLLATGATPRVLETARPDGERILTWQQVYALRISPST